MQYSILTVQIATSPEILTFSDKSSKITFFVKVLNGKKGYPYYYMKAVAKGEIGNSIANLYNQGDYLLIETNIQYNQLTRYSLLSINNDHPIF
uniref:Uncharacterized protein n=1 Tax=Helminthocladia australis TaxID=260093 RepID=A0A1G4NTI2_9FLOR|nr:Hypothetical protein ycf41 [Helminthocladia australis]SCW21947.1 Hypothetical protein ycf41 [Helminthocladia australis]